MIEAGEKSRDAYAEELVGKTVPVLLETAEENGTVHGYTDTYVPVVVMNGEPGQTVPVCIQHHMNGICYGVVGS